MDSPADPAGMTDAAGMLNMANALVAKTAEDRN